MARWYTVLLIVSVSLLAWLMMQAVHELGHVLAAWLTGGTVERVILHPLAISRTDIEPNPTPLVVTWGGPLVGVALPLALWSIAALVRSRLSWLARFFAGFCLLANGLYIGVGFFSQIGDAGDLVRFGAPPWTLWLYGLVTAPSGLALWHGTGKHFGLGRDPADVPPSLAYGSALALAAFALVETFLSNR